MVFREKPLELKLHQIPSHRPKNHTGRKNYHKRVKLVNVLLKIVSNFPFKSDTFLPHTKASKFHHYAGVYITKINADLRSWATCDRRCRRVSCLLGSLRIDDFSTTAPLDCVTYSLRMPIGVLAGVAPKSTTLIGVIYRRLGNCRT